MIRLLAVVPSAQASVGEAGGFLVFALAVGLVLTLGSVVGAWWHTRTSRGMEFRCCNCGVGKAVDDIGCCSACTRMRWRA